MSHFGCIQEVANHFNNFFSTVAENIGKDTVYDPSDHPSLIKKATGADGIPAKIIKCSKSIIAPQITNILNMSIDQNVFSG